MRSPPAHLPLARAQRAAASREPAELALTTAVRAAGLPPSPDVLLVIARVVREAAAARDAGAPVLTRAGAPTLLLWILSGMASRAGAAGGGRGASPLRDALASVTLDALLALVDAQVSILRALESERMGQSAR